MRLFALIGGLLLAVFVAALAVPPFVDWNTFRVDFERQASRVLGQPVEVRGTTSLRLLPLPRIEFGDLAIGRRDGSRPVLEARSFAMRMELAPLLRGDVRIVDMALDGAALVLEPSSDGSIGWLERDGTRSVTLTPEQVSLERFTITDSRLTLVRPGDDLALTGIDAELSARSLSGPWRGEGTFARDGQSFFASGSTGRVRRTGNGGEVSSRFTLRPADMAYDLDVAGPIAIGRTGLSMTGTFAFRPASPPLPGMTDQAREFAAARPTDPLPVRGSGSFRLDPEGAVAPSLRVAVGDAEDPYVLTGSAAAKFGDSEAYRLVLDGQQFDADRYEAEDSGSDAPARDRVDAVRSVLARVPHPPVPVTVDLSLPAARFGDTTVREVVLVARAEPEGSTRAWQVERLEALLPGRTAVEASGRTSWGDDLSGFTFDGPIIVASRQPSGLARWLGGRVDEELRRLKSAGVAGELSLGPGRVRIDDLELRLGADLLRGTLARETGTADDRPRLLADLSGSRLDGATAAALFRLLTGVEADATIASHDLNVRLDLSSLTVLRTEARGVRANAVFDDGDLSIDRMEVESVAGSSLDLNGRIDSLYDRPFGELSGNLELADPSALASFLTRRARVPDAAAHLLRQPALLAGTDIAFALRAERAGTGSEVRVTTEGTLGSSALEGALDADIEGTLRPAQFTSKLVLTNDEGVELLRLVGLDPIDQLYGPSRLLLDLEGDPSGIVAAESSMTFDEAQAVLAGNWVVSEGRFEGRVGVSGQNIAPLAAAGGFVLPGSERSVPGAMAADLAFDAASVTANKLDAEIAGVDFKGRLALDRTARPRPRIEGRLEATALDVEQLVALVIGEASPVFDFASDETPVGPPVLAGYDGSIDVAASEAELSFGLLSSEPATDIAMRLVLDDGALAAEAFEANWLGGRVEGRAGVSRAGERAAISANLALSDISIADAGFSSVERPILTGRANARIDVEAQGVTRSAMVAGLSGGGTVVLEDAVVSGLSLDILPDVLARADEAADEELEEAAPTILRDALLSGRTEFARVEVPFTIVAGNVRANGVDVATNGANVTADLRYAIPSGRYELELDGTFAQGEVAGTSPSFSLAVEGTGEKAASRIDGTSMTTFLSTRLRERREREFAAQQAAILERQRLARETRLLRLREQARVRARQREAAAQAEEPASNL